MFDPDGSREVDEFERPPDELEARIFNGQLAAQLPACIRSRRAARSADFDVVKEELIAHASDAIVNLLPHIQYLIRKRLGLVDSVAEQQIYIRILRVLSTPSIENQPLIDWAEKLGSPEQIAIVDVVLAIAKDKLPKEKGSDGR